MADDDPMSSKFISNYDFEQLQCDICREPFTHERTAKLLPCLHSVCEECLASLHNSDQPPSSPKKSEEKDETTDSLLAIAQGNKQDETDSTSCSASSSTSPPEITKPAKPSCPTCNTEIGDLDLIVNPFLHVGHAGKGDMDHQDGSPSEEKFYICTSCDENQKASSFCSDCQEWLCDPCVVAHKRVKITKDHTIRNKIETGDEPGTPVAGPTKRQMYCSSHKTEPLKLFCLTCEALTCRDCQLNEHKDHKYQFIDETIDQQKQALTDSIKELQEKMTKNEELSNKMSKKEKDIKKQQLEVFSEVRQVANTITDELIGWCKQLMNFLQGVCHGRLRDLSHKKKEADAFAKKAKHAVAFVEAALKSGDDLSILHAKSLMTKSLTSLQSQNVNVQPAIFDLEIKYENDASFLTKNVSKMGFINVNGKSYPQHAGSNEKQPENPLKNLTRENFSQNIADLLNKQPVHVRETYKNYSQDQKKLFLQKLMMQSQQQQQQQPQPQKNSQSQNRVVPFNSDAGAIRDLYSAQSSAQRQVNQVRPTGTYVPENPILKHRHLIQQQLQQQQAMLQQQQQGRSHGANFQTWRGNYGDQSSGTGNPPPSWGMEPANQPLMNLTMFCDAGPQGQQMPNNGQSMNYRPPVSTNQPSAVRFPPSGRFDIDPLNLRGKDPNAVQIKQEPKDRDYNASCQFSEKPNNDVTSSGQPHTSTSPRLQSPPTNSINPPSHTPSPSQLDGGTRTTISPALPDVGVMDTDRNELMKGLVNPSGHRLNSYHLHPKHDPSDPSEDYCGVCHNGGDLLCCERCPKVFHLQCHVPPLGSTLFDTWTCTMCIPDEELILHTPVFKEYEVTSTGKRKAPMGLVDKEIRVCERILLELFCLETSTVFHEPVPKSVPNYYKIIQQPMDFATIKVKLRRGHFNHYERIEDFISDVKLVFKNCYKFNAITSDIYSVGKAVEQFFEFLVQHYLPCYRDHLHQATHSPVNFDSNGGGDAPRNKKRRSPAPDTNQDMNPIVHFS